MVYGVIGNTAVFGTVVQGSSPCRPTKALYNLLVMRALFFLFRFFALNLPSTWSNGAFLDIICKTQKVSVHHLILSEGWV